MEPFYFWNSKCSGSSNNSSDNNTNNNSIVIIMRAKVIKKDITKSTKTSSKKGTKTITKTSSKKVSSTSNKKGNSNRTTYEIEKIVSHKPLKPTSTKDLVFVCKWKGYSSKYNTNEAWEYNTSIQTNQVNTTITIITIIIIIIIR